MMDRPFTQHPLRAQVVGEMQLRRVPALSVPARIVQLVRILDASQRDAEARAIATMLPMQGDARQDRHREGKAGNDIRIEWERHSEASTVTLVMTGRAAADEDDDGLAQTARDWAEALPGAVIRAVRLTIVADEMAGAIAVAKAAFRASQMVTCHVGGGARIWSDFRIHDDGYGPLVVAANGLLPGDLARCVQRLQELGNYRNLALLGLPPARAAWGELDALDIALEAAGQTLVAGDTRDDVLLATLTRLSAQLLSIGGSSGYRMSATAAYARIVASRLVELDVVPISGHPSLADFTERRLWPAVRTCAALTDRLAL
ncbi:MAG: DUF3422 domain-containing protein, partial [bacterium]|nr:DUF3422 domain-containing protein [bacterium]